MTAKRYTITIWYTETKFSKTTYNSNNFFFFAITIDADITGLKITISSCVMIVKKIPSGYFSLQGELSIRSEDETYNNI